MTSNSTAPFDSWVYDTLQGVYYQPSTSTYALPDPSTGEWKYLSSSEFNPAESSNTARQSGQDKGREEGEIEDDVGWGGLMEPEQLAAVVQGKRDVNSNGAKQRGKHPAYGGYDDPAVYAFPAAVSTTEDTPPPSMPGHLLRLVVHESRTLIAGQIAVIDVREGGIQIGRDRCEKGGQARVRIKEMEASKTHAVVYWGKGGKGDQGKDESEGWWAVDLGSTHGTFILNPSSVSSDQSKSGPKRLSEPKHSSQPYRLEHLSTVTIAGTTFIAHIHPSWPCDQCQLTGENEIYLDTGESSENKVKTIDSSATLGAAGPPSRWAMDSKEKRENRELKRKREMASLRENLLKSREITTPHNTSSEDGQTYLDRSAMRRRLHPPSPPKSNNKFGRQESPPLSTSSAPTPPPEPGGISKFAQGILASQGWTPGTGLGKQGDGRAEPVLMEMRDGRKGLGAKGSKAVVDVGEGDWRARGRQRRWNETSGAS